MKKHLILSAQITIATLLLAAGAPAVAAAENGDIVVTHRAETGKKLIPVSMSGFTGEVNQVLKFDLEVAGFTVVAADQAQYLITGSNNGHVEGRVTDRINKASLLARAYDGPMRAQAHALANDIVEALTGKKGIANTRIAFKVTYGGYSEIVVADYDGYNAAPITQDHKIVAAPCWAAGRRMIFYTSYLRENPDVYSQDLNTGARKVVARYTGSNISPAPSPDGRHVAMILSKAGSPDLYVSDFDGGNLRQLTTTKEDESSPCWSPDGRTICFASRASGTAALYTIPVEGGAMRRLRVISVGNATEPDWSPDGKHIAFTRTGSRAFDICVVPAQGGEAEILTEGEDPSWAPNSRTIIFARRVGSRRVLSLLDVPTKQVKNLPQISGSASQPSWAR
jgi:TolB protein